MITYKELLNIAEGLRCKRFDLTSPATGWAPHEGEYAVSVDIAVAGVTEAMTPVVTILPEDRAAALACVLAPHARTLDGALRLYAKTAPQKPIRFSLALISDPPPMGVLQEEESGAILDPRDYIRKDEIQPIPSSDISALLGGTATAGKEA